MATRKTQATRRLPPLPPPLPSIVVEESELCFSETMWFKLGAADESAAAAAAAVNALAEEAELEERYVDSGTVSTPQWRTGLPRRQRV